MFVWVIHYGAAIAAGVAVEEGQFGGCRLDGDPLVRPFVLSNIYDNVSDVYNYYYYYKGNNVVYKRMVIIGEMLREKETQ